MDSLFACYCRFFSAVAYYFGKMLQDSLKVPVGLICNAIGGSPTEAWVDRNTLEYKFPAILRNWTQNDFIQDWVRGRAALNVKKADSKQQRHPYEPCYLYEAGIRPLEQYPIKGIIWYQGESNAHNPEAHEKLFKLLLKVGVKTGKIKICHFIMCSCQASTVRHGHGSVIASAE